MGAGYGGIGTMSISDGIAVSSTRGYIGYKSGSTGTVTIDGTGSIWANDIEFIVGRAGNGTMNITNGGTVSNNNHSWIGSLSGSTGVVVVDGAGSAWTNNSNLYAGSKGPATLNITNGGLVSVAGTLTIDPNYDGDSFVNMDTGGMLALLGDADDSIGDFLTLVSGRDAIRYWDDSIADWADITGATYGADYTLNYLATGDLAGYTVLTVGVPEPATMSLLALGGLAILRRKRK